MTPPCFGRTSEQKGWNPGYEGFQELSTVLKLPGEWVLASLRWICVTTPHFEMYTTNSEKQAVQALQSFEQVRFFFLQNSKNKQAPEDLVRLLSPQKKTSSPTGPTPAPSPTICRAMNATTSSCRTSRPITIKRQYTSTLI